MELSLRALKESDYEDICSWWKWWRWPEIGRDTLPMNGMGGLMVYKDDILIAAGFLYLTNSNVALIEFVISNPQYRQSDRKDALEVLIMGLEDVSRSQGRSTIVSFARNKSLMNIHEVLGYTVDKNPSYEISKKIM
jgi:hypothetical protein